MDAAAIHGTTAPGFEAVAETFARHFRERRELGAAFCAYHRGVKVVDLWGGLADRQRGLPWEENTLAMVFSTTKGMAAMAMAVAHSRGLFELDQPVARYWSEFGQAGKEQITVRQLLAHQAGLVTLTPPATAAVVTNRQLLSDLLASQRPLWEPGSAHGYHAITLGWYQGELLRRVDPQGRTLGQFFREEIAEPLGADFFIGLPRTIPDDRLAHIEWPSMREFVFGGGMTWRTLLSFVNRRSMFWRALGVITSFGKEMFSREFLVTEVPSGTGIGNARSIARVYGAAASGELGLAPSTLTELTAPVQGGFDPVMSMDMAFHMGFSRPWRDFTFGSDAGAFGCPGMGGSFGFADPRLQVGYGYVCNQLGVHMVNDPRAKALAVALFRCLGAETLSVVS